MNAFISCTTTLSPSFDYLIIGAGPAGLLLANRLSAAPHNLSVAVVEAGDSARTNPNATRIPQSIAEFGPGLGTQLDWAYASVPQKYAQGRIVPYAAGKALGGSTVINGMTYVRAEKAQIDAWQDVVGGGGEDGEERWDWDVLWPYFVSQEVFTQPGAELVARGASWEDGVHGTRGELDVGFTPYLTGQDAAGIIGRAGEALGVRVNRDVNSGSMRGTGVWPMTMDVRAVVREDAGRAFYWPIAEERGENLRVFLNSTATRILWDDEEKKGGGEDGLRARGVEVMKQNGELFTLTARKEVILAAGSLQSPPLLERSGVGNKAVLADLGVEQVLDLPSVGSNLQDQPANGIIYNSSTNWTGYPTIATWLTAKDLFGDDLPAIRQELDANLSSYASIITQDYVPGSTTPTIQEALLRQTINLLFHPDSTVPLAEVLWAPYETSIIAQFWSLLPLSRGSVHAAKNNMSNPLINPNFFQLPIDTLVHAAIAVKIRAFFATAPLSQHVTGEITPGAATVPLNATSYRDGAWGAWFKAGFSSNSHPVSSCAMMTRGLGGVLDARAKVHGTRNVRVVDAAMWPAQISGHLSSVVYAVAGRVADLMLGES